MALASGPASFQRFHITGNMPADITDEFVEAVNRRAFGKVATLPDETQIGWIGPRHLFETDISAESIAFGRFAHFGIRIDRLRVPPNVLKAYVHMEEQAALDASGREFLNRGEKRRAREAAALRAEEEARSGGFRRMNSYPVLIDLDQRVVYLGSLSAGVGEKAMQLFSDSFGCALEPSDPEHVATRMMLAAKRGRSLENLAPFHLVDPPKDFAGDAADFSQIDLNFLGREFLSWLWFKTDADAGPLKLQAGDEVTVMIDKTLKLQCDFGLTGADVITADGPASLPESMAALKIGKQPTKAGLIVGSPLGEFRCVLDGARLTVSGLVLPEDNTEQDVRARIEQRFELIADAANLLDALYELFLMRRTGTEWGRELSEMRTWAGGGKHLKLRTG